MDLTVAVAGVAIVAVTEEATVEVLLATVLTVVVEGTVCSSTYYVRMLIPLQGKGTWLLKLSACHLCFVATFIPL